MKTANTKLAAILLALVMILTVMPVAAFADEATEATEETTEATTEVTTETTTEATTEETETETTEATEEETTEAASEEEPAAPTEAATDPAQPEALAAAEELVTIAAAIGTMNIGGASDVDLSTNHPQNDGHGDHSPNSDWSWNTDTATLTLYSYQNEPINIGSADSVTLVLTGSSTVNSDGYGISSDGALTISGSGSVTVTAVSDGIYSGGTLTIGGSARVTATGSSGIGINSVGGVSIGDSAVVVAAGLYAIYCNANNIEIGGSAKVTATATGGYGIATNSGTITISGGTVVVSNIDSSSHPVNISGGTVTINEELAPSTILNHTGGTVNGRAAPLTGTMTIGGITNVNLAQDHGSGLCNDHNHTALGWSWDALSGILTLNGYNGGGILIACDLGDEIKLVIAGDSEINASSDNGISCNGSLAISGGTLVVTSDGGTGISSGGTVSISGSANVTAKSTSLTENGIACRALHISGNANVTATGSDGIHGDLSVSGGTLKATSTTNEYGVNSSGAVTISGGTVEITGGKFGIYGSNVTLSGGSGTIKGDTLSVGAINNPVISGMTLLGFDGSAYTRNIKVGTYDDAGGVGEVRTFLDAETGTVVTDMGFSVAPVTKPEPGPEPEPEPEPEPSRPAPPSRSDDDDDDDDGPAYVPVIDNGWLDRDEARPLAASAKRQGLDARTSRPNLYGVKGSAWAELRGLRFYHDTTLSGAVQVRTYFDDPGLFSEDVRVSGYVSGQRVDSIRGVFEKWFTNPISVIRFDNSADWEHPVKVAARLDLALMDTKRLYFYAYNPATNSYKRIEQPEYRIDANGYLHFKTEFAGTIVVSEGELEKR